VLIAVIAAGFFFIRRRRGSRLGPLPSGTYISKPESDVDDQVGGFAPKTELHAQFIADLEAPFAELNAIGNMRWLNYQSLGLDGLRGVYECSQKETGIPHCLRYKIVTFHFTVT
jgi:hypothetical protein